MKRLFDIFFSSIGLLLLLPLFVCVALMIKVDSRGPILFRQRRVGKDFSRFVIYKFRTMVVDAERKGLRITSGGDHRVTRSGRILRKFKLDELPQLINVLRGDMSFVGPRPEVEEYVKLYEEDYREILKRRPGITDVSSIVFREEEMVLRNQVDPEGFYKKVLLPEKIRLAKEYLENASFSYDIRLILNTIYRIVSPSAVARETLSQKIIQKSSKES